MKKPSAHFGILISLIFFLSCGNMQTKEHDASDSISKEYRPLSDDLLRAVNDSLYAALNAMFTGDTALLYSIWSHADDVTLMGPFGGRLTGWEAVGKEFKKIADMKLGGKIFCRDSHIYAGTDVGYVICVEEGENRSPEGKPVMVSHRATNIFRLEGGQWKLIHHHTDISTQLENTFQDLNNK